MRANIAARDALYVALARSLDAELVTTDDRLANAVPDLVARLEAPQADDKDAPD
jgi:predicted nucleic acid-binding protein